MSDRRFVDADLPEAVHDCDFAVFEGEAVLYQASTRTLHRLDPVAGTVCMLCDGETPVAAMAQELSELFNVSPTEAGERVDVALAALADQGLLVGHEPQFHLMANAVVRRAPDGSRLLTAPADP